MHVLYLIMPHIDGCVDKKFQPSTFYRSKENHVSDIHTDISRYNVASLLIIVASNAIQLYSTNTCFNTQKREAKFF